MQSAETLPPGNQWKSSNTSFPVDPDMEITRPGDVNPGLQKLVDGIGESYMAGPEWRFESVI